jgi:hypothetical protein
MRTHECQEDPGVSRKTQEDPGGVPGRKTQCQEPGESKEEKKPGARKS